MLCHLAGSPGRAGLVLNVHNVVAAGMLLRRLDGAHPPNVVTRSDGGNVTNL